MLQFMRPYFSFTLGVALTLYGVSHSAITFPSGPEFVSFWNQLPQVGGVLLFLIGLTVLACGIALLVTGVRGIRRRTRQIRHSYSAPRYDHDEDKPEDWDSRYAY